VFALSKVTLASLVRCARFKGRGITRAVRRRLCFLLLRLLSFFKILGKPICGPRIEEKSWYL